MDCDFKIKTIKFKGVKLITKGDTDRSDFLQYM